jgi:hypothetical protein
MLSREVVRNSDSKVRVLLDEASNDTAVQHAYALKVMSNAHAFLEKGLGQDRDECMTEVDTFYAVQASCPINNCSKGSSRHDKSHLDRVDPH